MRFIGHIFCHRRNFRCPSRESESRINRSCRQINLRCRRAVCIISRFKHVSICAFKGNLVQPRRNRIGRPVCHISCNFLQVPTRKGIDLRFCRILRRSLGNHNSIRQRSVLVRNRFLKFRSIFIFKGNFIAAQCRIKQCGIIHRSRYRCNRRRPGIFSYCVISLETIPRVTILSRRILRGQITFVAFIRVIFVTIADCISITIPAGNITPLTIVILIQEFTIAIIEIDPILNIGYIGSIFRHRLQAIIAVQISCLNFFPF